MTMQVAMVGTDGIVLASDTRWAHTQRGSGNSAVRHTSSASKIKVSNRGHIAVACARNMETSGAIAVAIIAELTDQEWEYPILPMERISQRILDSAGDRKDFQCLIVCLRPTLRLFQLECAMVNGEPDRSICHQINDKAISGDNANSAVFWLERYYQRKPVQVLGPLAAQVVVTAGKLNAAAIGGLEIIVCDGNGIHRVSDESTSGLESAAEEWDRTIAELFAGYSQQLTYAPDVVG
jgi:hypothetical protein